jgi:hypothetical protein
MSSARERGRLSVPLRRGFYAESRPVGCEIEGGVRPALRGAGRLPQLNEPTAGRSRSAEGRRLVICTRGSRAIASAYPGATAAGTRAMRAAARSFKLDMGYSVKRRAEPCVRCNRYGVRCDKPLLLAALCQRRVDPVFLTRAADADALGDRIVALIVLSAPLDAASFLRPKYARVRHPPSRMHHAGRPLSRGTPSASLHLVHTLGQGRIRGHANERGHRDQ